MSDIYVLSDWITRTAKEDLSKELSVKVMAHFHKVREEKYWGITGLAGNFDRYSPQFLEHPSIPEQKIASFLWLATESALRLGLGSIFETVTEREEIAAIAQCVLFTALRKDIQAKQLSQVLSFALTNRPNIRMENAISWPKMEEWVQRCFDSSVTVHWRPDIFCHAALFSLGEKWLLDEVQYSNAPIPVEWHPAAISLASILDRHIKAAEKRLRPDQITSMIVELPSFLRSTDEQKFRIILARYCFSHSWDNLHDEDQYKKTDIVELASKVSFEYRREYALEYWQNIVYSRSRFCSENCWSLVDEYRSLSVWERWNFHRSLTQNQSRASMSSLGIPTKVTIYTTRGGKWAEHRFLTI